MGGGGGVNVYCTLASSLASCLASSTVEFPASIKKKLNA
jgi:hypothetical protein